MDATSTKNQDERTSTVEWKRTDAAEKIRFRLPGLTLTSIRHSGAVVAGAATSVG